MTEKRPFNPLDKRNLAASIAEALLERDPIQLDGLSSFNGTGVYALYYTGPNPAYTPLAAANQDGRWWAPIYVGKAIRKGGRKGVAVLEDENNPPKGKELLSRLREHADSIRAANSTLNIDDFYCRYLVVDEIWIPLGENLIISRFMPVWNTLIDGFGNHDPGSGRYQGLRPRWDVLHPGRLWALKCVPREETAATIQTEVLAYLNGRAFQEPTKLFR